MKKVLPCPSRPTILHDHAALHLADEAQPRRPARGAWLTKKVLPCLSRPTILHDHAALHLADEAGLALLITPDDLARSRRPALGGAGLTKKVLLCPTRLTILHDHAARHLADEHNRAALQAGNVCVCCVGTQDSGHVGSSKLDLLPSLTNCKKAA
jgi:hypothetical protein